VNILFFLLIDAMFIWTNPEVILYDVANSSSGSFAKTFLPRTIWYLLQGVKDCRLSSITGNNSYLLLYKSKKFHDNCSQFYAEV